VSLEHDVTDKEYSRPINVNDVDTGMKLVVYTWFPYQSLGRCTDVKDITLMDSWVVSAQGNFTKNTYLFPQKIGNSLNGCRMKAVIRDGRWNFTTKYVKVPILNGTLTESIKGLEYDLLNQIVVEQMNMSLFYVPTPKEFEMEEGSVLGDVVNSMFEKEIDIALGAVGIHFLKEPFLDVTNTHFTVIIRWYVPCSDKYPRWSSIFRILSVELWTVLIMSIVFVAISTTLVGRYSCTCEWQRYKTLASSLTNIWAVILGVPVSTMPHAPSLRSLFLAWVCFSIAFNTVFQAFLTTYLIDSGYKTPIQSMDELLDSGMKLAYVQGYDHIFETGDETEASQVKRNRLHCTLFAVCEDWAQYQKNVSLLLDDMVAEISYALGDYIGENSEPLICSLEDGVMFSMGLTMVMFHGDPLMKRVTEIIDRVLEAGIYNYWISKNLKRIAVLSRKKALVQPLDGYYSFNMNHMQPAFYLLLMGWCISVICFVIELLYHYVLSKTKCNW
jgi:hypothetical protein